MPTVEVATFGSELGGTIGILVDTSTGLAVSIRTPAGVVSLSGGGGGGGTFASITGQPTDNANLATALAGLLHNALGWDGTTPNLQSGVSPVAAFGSNAFVYTGAGGKVLDGQTYATGDLALWGQGGTSTFSKIPAGGAYLGSFANTGLLPAAASNPACSALVAGALYFSNGTAWSIPGAVASVAGRTGAVVLSSADLSDKGAASGFASLDSGGKVPVAQLPAAVLGALNYQGTYNAATNTPAIVAGNKGFYWKTATAGTSLGFTWNVGDIVVDNGTTIDKIDGVPSEVLSVAGRTGAVVLSSADLSDLAAAITTPLAGKVPLSSVGVAGGVAPNGDTVQVTANVTITTANQATYNGKVLEFTGAYSVTLSAGLAADFGFAAIPPATGVASIVSDTTTTFNGATTTVTRAASSYVMFSVTQRSTNQNAYVVT